MPLILLLAHIHTYRAAVTTLTASIGGGVAAIVLSYATKKKSEGRFDISYLNNGVLGGLVGITGDLFIDG